MASPIIRRNIFCATCPVLERCAEAPEVLQTVPVQQIAGYIGEMLALQEAYFVDAIEESKLKLGQDLQPDDRQGLELLDEDALEDGVLFKILADDVRERSLAYLDLLPADVSDTTLLALGACAHNVANGACENTNPLQRYNQLVFLGHN